MITSGVLAGAKMPFDLITSGESPTGLCPQTTRTTPFSLRYVSTFGGNLRRQAWPTPPRGVQFCANRPNQLSPTDSARCFVRLGAAESTPKHAEDAPARLAAAVVALDNHVLTAGPTR